MYETPKANLDLPKKEKGAMPASIKAIAILIIIEAIVYIASLYSLLNEDPELGMEFFYIGAVFSFVVCFYMLNLLKKGEITLRMILTAFLIISLISGALDITDAGYQITTIVILDALSILVLLTARLLFTQDTVLRWFDLQ